MEKEFLSVPDHCQPGDAIDPDAAPEGSGCFVADGPGVLLGDGGTKVSEHVGQREAPVGVEVATSPHDLGRGGGHGGDTISNNGLCFGPSTGVPQSSLLLSSLQQQQPCFVWSFFPFMCVYYPRPRVSPRTLYYQ